MLTQALLGDEASVLAVQGEWLRILLPDQPSSLHDGGYPGWVPSCQVVPWPPAPSGREIVISALTTAGHRPLGLGTALRAGPNDLRTLTDEPVEVAAAQLTAPSGNRATVVHAAEAFLLLPYLWGGASGWGVDCSGLAWLCHRRCGVRIPRDAHDQLAAGTEVDLARVEPGDLVFFARPGERIHHVGIASSGGEMLHAPETDRGVERRPIARTGADPVAARRYLDS